MTNGSPFAADLRRRRIRQFWWITFAAAVGFALVYLLAVRTEVGQRFDDLAFEGRAVEDPEVTRVTNELLHTVTKSTLALLTLALILFGLARRQVRLAATVGATVAACVVTSEVLRLHVLTRPDLDGVAGIQISSYPSGHATIGMALSLGLVMIVSDRRRWIAVLPAAAFSMLFGAGVLATGWHRPSDTLGAFLVCAVWFSAAGAFLLARGTAEARPHDEGDIEVRLSWPMAAAAGAMVAAAGVAALLWSVGEDQLRAVDYGVAYLLVCAVLLCLAVAEVVGYHQMLRGLTLDRPRDEVAPSPQLTA